MSTLIVAEGARDVEDVVLVVMNAAAVAEEARDVVDVILVVMNAATVAEEADNVELNNPLVAFAC